MKSQLIQLISEMDEQEFITFTSMIEHDLVDRQHEILADCKAQLDEEEVEVYEEVFEKLSQIIF